MNPITGLLSGLTGVPESTLRLVLTVILGYPISSYYKKRFLSQSSSSSTVDQRNQYILLSGLVLNFFFNGLSIYHSLLTVGLSWTICFVVGENMGNRKLAAAGVWIFNALYLLLGYYFMQTDDYDITWTMTQCILCLRMMGFAFDYYDGSQPQQAEPKKSAVALPLSFRNDTPLPTLPDIQQFVAYSVFPTAFLVGPQFSFSLYSKWIQDDNSGLTTEQKEERNRAQTLYIWRCAILAVIYLGLQQTVGSSYSTAYLLTKEYQSFCFIKRLLIFLVAGKFAFNKYIGIWLLTEGATAGFGISFEGNDEEGHASYGGLANALPSRYETATSIDHIIGSFNINTNLWSKYYVFKRLKFLGNKNASQFGTLAFLAIWHGFHPIYFITFLLEFLCVQCELVLRKRLLPVVQPYTKKNDIFAHVWKGLSWFACQATITYCVVGFELLNLDKAWSAYKSVYFLGHILIAVILAVNQYLPKPRSAIKKAQ
ncbi:hypothetical protein MFLAVUS_005711 [Mucor flavus]|uniref:Lysophospholipid acyltransferase 5 n=1 Tax=Mucor flavus TaxID=439312 RepID=A0ABP9YZG5_9FUNG